MDDDRYYGWYENTFAELLGEKGKGEYISRKVWKEQQHVSEQETDIGLGSEPYPELHETYVGVHFKEMSIYDTTFIFQAILPSGCCSDWYRENDVVLDNPLIHNIALVIELPTLFADLSVEDKFLLFSAKYGNIIGNISLYQDLLFLIFCEKCKGNFVDDSSSRLVIPLYSFNNGLNLYNLKCSSINGFLKINNKLANCKFSLRVNWEKSNKAPDLTYKQTPILLGSFDRHSLADKNSYRLCANGIIKYILIYFIPKNASNYWDLNENYPIVTKATIKTNNQIFLEFENEDLLDFGIFGITIYLLPLSKEVSNWDSISEVFKNFRKLTSSGLNANSSRINDIIIDLEIENQPSDPYYVSFIPMHLNILVESSGMIMLRYCY